MLQENFEIASNLRLANNVYELTLLGDSSAITAPGQFISLRLDGYYLRRPISVCDVSPGSVTIIYKVLGQGTEQMTHYAPGKRLDVLVGLGNGFDVSRCGQKTLLVGGGVGLPPMYLLARRLLESGRGVAVAMGFAQRGDIFYEDKLRALGAEVCVATTDGSYGVRGLVTDAMARLEGFDYICACGPEPMLKAVYDASGVPGQFSFEERMGCGFGACMGCSCRTKYGYKRICRDGPVLDREEIIW